MAGKNEITGRSKFAKATNSKFANNNKGSKINWIESLLKTPLDDYRKTIVNLVLAPYLVNIRQIEYQTAFAIIKEWLEQCATYGGYTFVADSLTGNALQTAKNSRYRPMRLDTLKQRNPTIFGELK